MLGSCAGTAFLAVVGYALIASTGTDDLDDVPAVEPAAPVVMAPSPGAPAGPALPEAPAPAAPVSLDGILLKGVMGGGPEGGAAIISAAGEEHPVRVGRDVQPGLRLKSIGVAYAVLSTSGGDVRIELNRAGATSLGSVSPTASQPAAASPATAATERRETIEFQLGLKPMRSNGRVAGFALRPDARIPRFQRAGLVPGDVIVAVNGSGFDEERLMELSWGLANSTATELEFIRNGRRMKVQL